MIRHRAAGRAVGLLLAGATLAACTADAEPTAAGTSPPAATADETATPTPSASPTPDLQQVEGKRTVRVHHLGSRPLLGLGGNPEPETKAINRAARQVGNWLDAHLDELQRTGAGRFGAIAARQLARADADRTLVTTHLASPDAPVKAAAYVMDVYHDGSPRYLTTRVTVRHPDDSVSRAELVFGLEGGKPELTMYGPAKKKARG